MLQFFSEIYCSLKNFILEILFSESNGIGTQEQPHPKNLEAGAGTLPMAGHLNANSQMELVSHSIVCASFQPLPYITTPKIEN